MTNAIFSYGSNMNLKDLRAWLSDRDYNPDGIISHEKALLKDYVYIWNYYSQSRKCGAANIEYKPDIDVYIWGVLIYIEDSLIKGIDRKEGHPDFYHREFVTVQDSNEKPVKAITYIANHEKCKQNTVYPSEEYKNLIVEAAKEHRFPSDYIKRCLETIETRL